MLRLLFIFLAASALTGCAQNAGGEGSGAPGVIAANGSNVQGRGFGEKFKSSAAYAKISPDKAKMVIFIGNDDGCALLGAHVTLVVPSGVGRYTDKDVSAFYQDSHLQAHVFPQAKIIIDKISDLLVVGSADLSQGDSSVAGAFSAKVCPP